MPSGLRLTKKIKKQIQEEGELEIINRLQKKSRAIFMRILDVDDDDISGLICTDQTGALPAVLGKGNRCIMVMLECGSDCILVKPMRNKTTAEMLRAHQHPTGGIEERGIFPAHQVLDNQVPDEHKHQITKVNQVTCQLVPPGDHQQNIAEKAIQVFKDHFVANMCGIDPRCPLHLWCQFLPQTEKTLNFARPLHMVPTISSYAHAYGQYNYNTHPIAPFRCATETCVAPKDRGMWESHAVSGFHIGTSMEHYRCCTEHATSTRANRMSQTAFFCHKYLTMPTAIATDVVFKAAEDLKTALGGNLPQNCTTKTAIDLLMKIFKQKAKIANKGDDAIPQRVEHAEAQRVVQEKNRIFVD